jgi:hypothetical protein
LTKLTLESAIGAFGAKAKEKLANPAAVGQPEDQLRAPFESLLADLAELSNLPKEVVTAVGESSVNDLKTRPDYAVTVHNALVGFFELKAPGKGADPRKFKDPHDKAQWEKLRSLPNLVYTDGNSFSLWQNGELAGTVLTLVGDIESSGNKIQAPPGFLSLFESFLTWEPVAPRSAKDLAHTTARLCRLLRDEVTEQLALGSEALTDLDGVLLKQPSESRGFSSYRPFAFCWFKNSSADIVSVFCAFRFCSSFCFSHARSRMAFWKA